MLGMNESLCGVYLYSSNLHIMTSSGGGTLEFHNIQEIVDIDVCFLSFYPHYKLSGKEETNNKTGESTKLLLYYYIVVKRM